MYMWNGAFATLLGDLENFPRNFPQKLLHTMLSLLGCILVKFMRFSFCFLNLNSIYILLTALSLSVCVRVSVRYTAKNSHKQQEQKSNKMKIYFRSVKKYWEIFGILIGQRFPAVLLLSKVSNARQLIRFSCVLIVPVQFFAKTKPLNLLYNWRIKSIIYLF